MVRKTFSILSTVIVVLVVILAVLLAGVRLIGFKPFSVLSPSMTPKYDPGDMVYVKSKAPAKIQKGDVITFILADDTVATHRVDAVDREQGCFYTKGDANEFRDSAPVYYENVIGTVVFSIPKLGYLSAALQGPSGKFIIVAVIAILALILLIPPLAETFTKKPKGQKADEMPPVGENSDPST